MDLYNAGLTTLALEGNRGLIGTIRPEIATMTSLKAYRVGRSGLGGELPDELFTLPQLESLHLNDASFFGTLPEEGFAQLADTLVSLRLFNNNFSGPIPIQSIVAALSLEELILYGNLGLTGSVPWELCNRRGFGNGKISVLWVDCDNIGCLCCDRCT